MSCPASDFYLKPYRTTRALAAPALSSIKSFPPDQLFPSIFRACACMISRLMMAPGVCCGSRKAYCLLDRRRVMLSRAARLRSNSRRSSDGRASSRRRRFVVVTQQVADGQRRSGTGILQRTQKRCRTRWCQKPLFRAVPARGKSCLRRCHRLGRAAARQRFARGVLVLAVDGVVIVEQNGWCWSLALVSVHRDLHRGSRARAIAYISSTDQLFSHR